MVFEVIKGSDLIKVEQSREYQNNVSQKQKRVKEEGEKDVEEE